MFSLFRRTDVELLYSGLYDEVSFYTRFKDIKQARKSVLMESPYLTIRRAVQFASIAAKVSRKGVSIKVFTRYPGHHTPRLRAEVLLLEPSLAVGYRKVLEEIEAAKAIQSESDADENARKYPSTSPSSSRAAEALPNDLSNKAGTAQPALKKRFYGSLELDPILAKAKFADVVDEVIQQFSARTGVKVRVSIEIEADSVLGFDDGLQRAVKENCNVLKFKLADFE